MSHPLPLDPGDRVKQLRLQLGLSQIDLARLLGVSNVTVNRWERGRAVPGLATVQRVEALANQTRPTGRMPIPSTPFVGRTRELAAITRLVDETRLLSLVGPPGCGKTRLAIETATRVADRFDGGVWFVDLASLPRASEVAGRVADVLGIQASSAVSTDERVTAALADRTLLLVLDNCEHVTHHCREFLDRVLPVCPAVRVLATSRAPLLQSQETIHRVPTLALPPPAAGAEEIARTDAVALFVQRARQSRPDFALTPAVAPVVADICRRLDGLPLAIELAAAHLSILSVAQIAQRLGDRFGLLRQERSEGTTRQRTLAAAIDWSHDLLGDAERRLFGRLAVFAGGFDVDAIEAICTRDGETGRRTDDGSNVLDLLSALIGQSLVVAETDRGAEAPVRYRLLESLREYAAGTIGDAGEEAAMRRRHASHYLRRAQLTAADFGGAGQPGAIRRLLDDDGNLHTALSWAIAEEDGGIALSLAAALWRFWHSRGRYAEGVAWLESVLAFRGSGDARTVAEATYGLARLRMRLARYPAAAEAAETSRAAFAALGDPAGEARSLNLAGLIAQRSADYARSRVLHEEALAISQTANDARGLIDSLVQLGQLSNLDQEYSSAEQRYAEAWRLIRQTGDLEEEAAVLNNLGDNAARRGDGQRALGYYERSLTISRALDHPEGIAAKLVNLAEARLLVGDATSALPLAEEGVARYRALANREHTADALYVLGLILTNANDQPGALVALREALDLFHAVGNVASAGQTLDLLAGVVARLGDTATAARWLGAAEAMRHRVGANPYPPSGYAGIASAVRKTLGDTAYLTLFAAGAAQSDAQSLVEATVYIPPDGVRPDAAAAGPLTDRQEEILRLVGQGMSNREIGHGLGISIRTVERHLTEMYAALGVSRRTEAVAVALSRRHE